MRTAVLLAWSALALFCVSLILPSVDVDFLGKPMSLAGFHIIYMALGFGIAMLGEVATGTARGGSSDVSMYLASFAAAFNFLFPVVPVLLHRRMLAARGLGIYALLAAMGLIAGAATPTVFGKSVAGVNVGFYVWLLAYLLLLVAVLVEWRGLRAERTPQP